MFKTFFSRFSFNSFSFNLGFSFLLFFVYNTIFLQKLYNVIGFNLSFIAVIAVIILLLFIAGNLLFWRYTVRPLAIIFLMLNAFCLYFMSSYNISIDKIMLLNALQTDKAEAFDLINLRLLAFLLVAGILPSLLIFHLNIHFSSFAKEFLHRLLFILGALVLIAAIIFPNFKNTAQFLRNNRSLKYQLLPVNYVGAVISAIKIVRKSNRELIKIGQDAVFEHYWDNDKPNLLVFVVGETARAQNFSLGGYNRDTNRELKPFANEIIYFSDTTACGTSTAISLPCIFSAKGRSQFKPGSEAYTENLLDIFNRNNYKAFWRENNSGCKNNCDRIESETFCTNYTCKDEILIKDFSTKVNSAPENIIMVLHQQGSHGPAYYERYPKEFERYTPTCQTNNLNRCTQEEIINSYDNSIAYTTHMLALTIKELQKLANKYNVMMFYASDHGESLGENGIYLHAAPYIIAPEEQTKVPMLLWLDSTNANAFNLDINCIRTKATAPYSHDNIFHTLLGIGGIKSSEYNNELDILQSCRKK